MVATVRDEIRTRLAAWVNDPVLFVREVLLVEPDPWQAAVLDDLRDHRSVAVRSCHGPGKTTCAAWAVLWFLTTHAHPRVPCTAPKEEILLTRLWPEIAKWLGRSRLLTHFLEWQKTKVVCRQSPNTWFAVATVGRTPENLSGFHEEHLLYVVEEASGMRDELMGAVDGAMTTQGAKVLMISNPTQLTGYFYDAFHRDRARWKTHHVSAHDSPRVKQVYIDGMAAKWGVDGPMYQVRVLGEFPTQAEDALLGIDALERATRVELASAGPVVLGVDVARLGNDETVILTRQGPVVRGIRTARKTRTTETTGLVIAAIRDERAEVVYIDEPGVGGGVVDELLDAQERGDIPPHVQLVPVNVGMPAVNGTEFSNMRAEAYWTLRSDIDGGRMQLPDDEVLIGQLSTLRWKMNSRGKVQIEGKDDMRSRGVTSPDRADALMLTCTDGAGVAAALGVDEVTDMDLNLTIADVAGVW